MTAPKKQKPASTPREEKEKIRAASNEPLESAALAQDQAEKDIESDPDLSIHSPNDDLDEGESARLGENTDLV